MLMKTPSNKPTRPFFSSGPCVKPLGVSHLISYDLMGRSHRSVDGIAMVQNITDHIRQLLHVPDDYKIAIVPGSATGACEMLLWNLLGQRVVDVFAWDVFGKKWLDDIQNQLKISHRAFVADFGQLPQMSAYNADHDLCFTWAGTTAGVAVVDVDWIPEQRTGLVLCDMTSAAFSFIPPWHKLDGVAFSFQKVLGSEASNGVIILSPKACERLQTYAPVWPVPSLLGLRSKNGMKDDLFQGKLNNTPCMGALSDTLHCLEWLIGIGGISAAQQRIEKNYQVLANWVKESSWIEFFVQDEKIRSKLAVTLKPKVDFFAQASTHQQWDYLADLCSVLTRHRVGYDVKGHAQATPHWRIWCGPTVEHQDLQDLLPWLDYAALQTGLV